VQLTSLSVQHVRRIAAAEISPSGGSNLISGPNGSGKTSLLESIHFLATARSFRTTRAADVISHGEKALVVSGELKDSDGINNRVGVEKTPTATRLRFNGEAVKAASTIARLVPVLTFNTESYLLMDGGPANRRALLDRLLFHVEHEYLETLKLYYRGLKQRNSLLRSKAGRQQVASWDRQIAMAATKMDAWRSDCVSIINEYLAAVPLNGGAGPVRLEYRRGWPQGEGLGDLLNRNWQRDRDLGTTTVGPHRAELRIQIDEKLAKRMVSRGQGKLIIAAIVGAQARYLYDHAMKVPILLVDDLAAELDRTAREVATDYLLSTHAQIFFTAIEPSDLPGELCQTARMFHVEHGNVRAVARD